jgi:hypothetical protein
VKFTPPDTGGYIRFDHLPAETRQITLGDNGENRFTGLAQFSVFWREGEGIILASEAASVIIELFKRGTEFASDGQTIRIVAPPYLLPSVVFDGWVQVAVRVPYLTDAPNP